jgi:transposase
MEDFRYGQGKLDELVTKLGINPKDRRPKPFTGENRAERRAREKKERRKVTVT